MSEQRLDDWFCLICGHRTPEQPPAGLPCAGCGERLHRSDVIHVSTTVTLAWTL